MGLLVDIGASFILGLLTPLTAVCVLPLYPAFLSFLSNKFSGGETAKRGTVILFGFVVVAGVLAFMLALGLIFTTLFQQSLTNVIDIVSPIAFGFLGVISLLLIFNVDFSRFLPKIQAPAAKNPLVNAFGFGFFFGAIVIPCNPGFIAAFFARAFLVDSFIGSISNFLAFGVGLGAPLLVFAVISGQWSQAVIGFLTKHKRKINLIAGILMLWVSLYYLTVVFEVFTLGPVSDFIGFVTKSIVGS